MIPILNEIRTQGLYAIWMNLIPSLKEWWMSYQPIDFTIRNYFGTRKDLCKLCEEARNYGIRIFADVICNHMVGKRNAN